jgi:hypothetical protein
LAQFRKERPTLNDWRRIFRPVDYDFEHGWHLGLITLLSALVLAASLWFGVERLWQAWGDWAWWHGLILLGGVAFLAGLLVFVFDWKGSRSEWRTVSFAFGPAGAVIGPLLSFAKAGDWEERALSLASTVSGWFCILLTSAFLLDLYPWYGVVALWLGIIGCSGLLAWQGTQRSREARNPLHGLLDPPQPVAGIGSRRRWSARALLQRIV